MKANLKRVLVVDDDPVIGKSFDRILSGKGYAVITARDGDEALAKLRSEDYDVVYTDIRMPGMDGVEVAKRVKAERPWLPVVIISGYGSTENVDRAWAVGVSGFLRKPLSPEMIEDSALEATRAAAPVAPAPAIAAEAAAAPASAVKNVALFLAAPFIGLAYVIALPFVGAAMLLWMLAKRLHAIPALGRAWASVRNVALFIGAPFIGLAYVIAGPFIGLAVLARYGKRALFNRHDR